MIGALGPEPMEAWEHPPEHVEPRPFAPAVRLASALVHSGALKPERHKAGHDVAEGNQLEGSSWVPFPLDDRRSDGQVRHYRAEGSSMIRRAFPGGQSANRRTGPIQKAITNCGHRSTPRAVWSSSSREQQGRRARCRYISLGRGPSARPRLGSSFRMSSGCRARTDVGSHADGLAHQ